MCRRNSTVCRNKKIPSAVNQLLGFFSRSILFLKCVKQKLHAKVGVKRCLSLRKVENHWDSRLVIKENEVLCVAKKIGS